MTKAELINLIAEKGDYSKKDAEKALTAEKTAINPRTKEQITVAAKKVPAFKAGKALKDAVNK